jgi:hypothetical protein
VQKTYSGHARAQSHNLNFFSIFLSDDFAWTAPCVVLARHLAPILYNTQQGIEVEYGTALDLHGLIGQRSQKNILSLMSPGPAINWEKEQYYLFAPNYTAKMMD